MAQSLHLTTAASPTCGSSEQLVVVQWTDELPDHQAHL